MRRSFRSPSTATASNSTRSSAPSIPGSWSQTAGTVTATSTPSDVRCAGRTCNAISAVTPMAWANRSPSASRASRSPRRCSPPGTPTSTSTTTAPGFKPRSRRSRPNSAPLLEDASPKKARNRWHRQFANNLLKVWPALWTFTTIDGVEPTNNPAERALRGPVIHRKVSLGTQSTHGERFAERAHSAAATCRMQHRSLFTYLSELLTAHIRGDPFPTLA